MLCLALACMLCVGALAEGAGYTVEFGYGGLEYVLPGDTSVAMSDIQDALGLPGEVTAVAVSAPGLFSASKETGEWVVTAHRAFDTAEWMKVTVGGVVYEITVTDDVEPQFVLRDGSTYVFTSDRIKPEIRIIWGDNDALLSRFNYARVEYGNNTNVGTCTVNITVEEND